MMNNFLQNHQWELRSKKMILSKKITSSRFTTLGKFFTTGSFLQSLIKIEYFVVNVLILFWIIIINPRAVRPWFNSDWIFGFSAKGREQAKCLKTLHKFTDKVRKKYPELINCILSTGLLSITFFLVWFKSADNKRTTTISQRHQR